MSVALLLDRLLEICQLGSSLLLTQSVTFYQVMSFLGETNFVSMAMHSLANYVMSFRLTC